jgi:predicted TIM-barrel fold metal-dependent hydrolase
MPPRYYFDANAYFGSTAAAVPDMPTCADRLAHMDRLGIARAVVWHVAARDYYTCDGNARLLAEIAATPGARERLVPALVIAPTLLYERGAMDDLRALMQTHGIRALRFALSRGEWSLLDIEPVLAAVQELSPTLFLSFRDPLPKRDVLDIAAAFPAMPIVYTEAMWPHMVNALDLLRRRPNIVLDTSWNHCYHLIPQIAEEFGPERQVFGAGFASHAGAAIGALAQAEVSDDVREAIAHGTLERLLGLQPLTETAPAPAGNPLWTNLLDGRAPGVEIIDAHGHNGPISTWVVRENDAAKQVELCLRWMDRLGISTMLVSGMEALFTEAVAGNRALEAVHAPHVDRFKGYLGFNPFYADRLVPLLDDFFSRDFFVGFKLLGDYWRVPMTDPRFTPVWEYADAHRMPILLHTWDGAYDPPSQLTDIAPKYPNAVFLLGHSGGSNAREEAITLAQANPNVYLEWCGSFTGPACWVDTLRRVGHRQVVFGTDAIAHDPYWELARLLSQDIPADWLPAILSGNMREILGQVQKAATV